MTLEDQKLVELFLMDRLDPDAFDHDDHLRLTWLLFQRFPAEQVLAALAAGLKKLTARAGDPAEYHATVTFAYVALVDERRLTDESFDVFRKRCPELFDGTALKKAYGARLDHPDARSRFLLP